MPSSTKLPERTGERTLGRLLAERAQADPDAPAILSPEGESLPAAELLRRVEAVQSALSENGVGRSDRVAVVAGLGPDAAVAVLGAASWGTCVPVSPSATAELGALLAETRARAVLTPHGASAAEEAAAEARGASLLDRSDIAAAADGRMTSSRVDDRPAPDDDSLLLRTSGSTGRAKLVPATHRQLFARADAAQRVMRLGTKDRCLNPMPLCYGHGIYTGLLFPLLTGGSTILPGGFDEESFMGWLDTLSPTWYTAGPAHQQAILGWLRQRPDETAAHSLSFARCANASLPPEVREELEALLGVPVLETYGTSEAGMITSPDPFGPRKDGTVGAAAGVEVAVLDESGAAVPRNASGEIVVRGPTVFSGYEGDAELSRRSLTDGWLRTGDLGSLDEDGFLSLEGRVDDVINRGGEKVSPQEVEELLRAHPDVAEAVVFGVPHPTLGQEVGAAVTLVPEHEAAEDALRAYLGDSVATFKVPRRLVVLTELPAGPTGKPLRAGMAERLGLNLKPADGEGTEPPSGPMETILARAWGEVLERGDIGPDDDFFEQGGDSLAAVELFAVIDEEIRVELSLEDLVEAPTPRLLAHRMLRGAYLDGYEPAAGRDIVAVNAPGSKPPLFAVGGRPGHALRVLLVGRELGPDQPVYGLQPPGMDWHASGLPRLTQMAAHHVSNVRKAQPQGPYRLLGSSFGGLMVFEMALQLERAGEEVEFLGLVDSEPPGLSWMAEADPLPHALEDLDAPSGPSIDRGGNIVTSGSRVSLAHIDARRTYVITDRLRCPLTLFLCAAEGVPPGGDRRRLWAETTTGGLRLVELPGLHAAFDREPQFSALRDALRSLLAGEPPLELDPELVFDRTYTLEAGSEGEVIRGNDGSSFRVEEGAMRGRARAVKARRGKLLVRGWASDPERRRSGETVVAFLGGRYAGYSTCGAPTERLERRHSAPGLRYAGFRLRLDLPADGPLSEEPRLFALDQHGRASELRVTA